MFHTHTNAQYVSLFGHLVNTFRVASNVLGTIQNFRDTNPCSTKSFLNGAYILAGKGE